MNQGKPKLLDRVRAAIQVRHYSIRTEKSYIYWIRFYIRFHRMRHPSEMGKAHIEAFLAFLAGERKVSASTQNQALSALLFLYRNVLDRDPGKIESLVRARRRENVPTVFTPDEAARVLDQMSGSAWLMASLLYGSGLRLTEMLRLRVKDLDFTYRQVFVRNGKGGKDRTTPMPDELLEPLKAQLAKVRLVYEADLETDWTGASLPPALARKYPNAPYEWAWQFVFPASKRSPCPYDRTPKRHHLHHTALQKAVKRAVRASEVAKQASCHTFRPSFATHLIESGYDIRTVQELLGHRNVETTMIYTHVLERGGRAVRSPLDLHGGLRSRRPRPGKDHDRPR